MQYEKIQFFLEIDEDGYPPVGSETLNAIVLGSGEFQIDNTPFFATSVALGDVVLAKKTSDSGDKFLFYSHVSFSENHSLSIIFLEDTIIEDVFSKLKLAGCYCEYGEFRGGNLKMLAVSVPNTKVYNQVIPNLLKLESDDFLSVAELCYKEN